MKVLTLGLGLVLLSRVKLVASTIKSNLRGDLPRSVRYNNPGNIKNQESNKWKGETPSFLRSQKIFEEFQTMELGARAQLKLLSNYINGGNNTLETIITKWAPPIENDTKAYIKAVAKATALSPKGKLVADEATLKDVGLAMALHEAGGSFGVINESLYDKAYELI